MAMWGLGESIGPLTAEPKGLREKGTLVRTPGFLGYYRPREPAGETESLGSRAHQKMKGKGPQCISLSLRRLALSQSQLYMEEAWMSTVVKT